MITSVDVKRRFYAIISEMLSNFPTFSLKISAQAQSAAKCACGDCGVTSYGDLDLCRKDGRHPPERCEVGVRLLSRIF